MPKVTALIAEDEPLLRAEIRDLLRTQWPDLEVVAEVGDGIEALRAIREQHPDVAFLDVQMPGLTGLEVAARTDGDLHVVFITAYDSYAIEAFNRGALDYILKPVSAGRLALTVKRVQARLQQKPMDLQSVVELLRGVQAERREYLEWLTVPHGDAMQFITVAEICYLRAEDKYASVVTANAAYLLSSSLKQMREKLDPRLFWQIHRGIIVNTRAIQSVHRTFRGALEIRLKARREILPVSASRAGLFKHL